MATSGDASRLRTSRLLSGIGSSVLARAATSLSPLILIPITLSYLGDAQYGTWMAVVSLTSMLLWADLGLGNGLLTRLSPLITYGEWARGRRVVSSAYQVLVLVSVAGCIVAISSYWLVPWDAVFNTAGTTDAGAVTLICLVAFALNIPLSLVHRVLFAVQRVNASNGVLLVGAVIATAAAYVAVLVGAPRLTVIGVVMAAPVVTNAGATVWVFHRLPALRPTWRLDRVEARGLLSIGVQFLAVAVLTSLALNADNLVVAHTASIEAVADYSVVMRVFSALGLLVTIVNLPLWPANAEALALGDRRWVRRTTTRMVLASGGCVATAGLILLALSDAVLGVLGGGEPIHAPPVLLLGFVAMWAIVACTSPLFMVQNSIGLIRPQLIGWAVFLCLSVPAKILVSSQLGVSLLPWTGAGLYLSTVVPSAYWGYRVSLRASPVARPEPSRVIRSES